MTFNELETTKDQRPTVTIVGSGMCGMFTGLALDRRGFDVTIIERDVPPPDCSANEAFFSWQRKGVAQFRHPHAFLGLMCSVLEENYPDLLERFFEAGARKVSFEDSIPDHLKPQYNPEPGDEKMWVLMCRRATMETVLRTYVTQTTKVTIRNQVSVADIITEKNDSQEVFIRGLSLIDHQESNKRSELFSDIVIDATGRSSKFDKWLTSSGVNIKEERDDAEIVYYTRHYRLKDGVSEPPRDAKNPSMGDLGYMKYGIFPGDGGHFALIICLPNEEKELRKAIKSGEKFDEIGMTIPGLRPWLSKNKSEATTAPFGIGNIHAVWRDFTGAGNNRLLNFFAVGDSAIRTNPLYGRGCSTGALHAHILADILSTESDPWSRALRFQEESERKVRPIFQASLNEDKRGIKRAAAIREGVDLDKADSLKKWFALAFGDALMAASRDKLFIHREVMKTINLVEKPGEFLKNKKIQRTVFKYMLRGRKRNAGSRIQPGLTRPKMLEFLTELDSKQDLGDQADKSLPRAAASAS
tara:strand:+ start:9709 stop:11292 length:1584 start_codon:yes stop_codon:yes gene_type:complete